MRSPFASDQRRPVPRMALLLAVVLAVASLVACQRKPQEFKSEAGRFSIMTPVAMTEQVQTTTYPKAGTIKTHMFSGDQRKASYAVAYADYPDELINQSDADTLLDGGRNGAVANVNGKLVLESRISLEGHPGREIVVSAKAPTGEDATVKARLYLVNNRLYIILVAAAPGAVSNDEMMAFLQSFKLT